MELDCGIQQARIVSWLTDELALARDDACWVFDCEGGNCRIEVSPLPNRAIGRYSIERTLVSISGDKAAIESFYDLFTLQFLSAGG